MLSFELALRLKQYRMHQRAAMRPGKRRLLDVAGALVTIDPAETSPYPWANPNRAAFLGCEQTVGPVSIDLVVRAFRRAEVPRFFFWMYPCPQFKPMRTWLAERGFTRVEDNTFPVLVRRAIGGALPPTSLEVRQVGHWEAARQQQRLADIYGGAEEERAFRQTVGQPGFHHFMAFDGDDAVAAALLWTKGDFGYLAAASTAEAYRARGAHSALIQARLNKAAQLGCTWTAAEAASLQETALANLEKQGFSVHFDCEVFAWSDEAG